jgi:hypothetical protein
MKKKIRTVPRKGTFPDTERQLTEEISARVAEGRRCVSYFFLSDGLLARFRRAELRKRFVELAKIEKPEKAARCKFSNKIFRSFMKRNHFSNRYLRSHSFSVDLLINLLDL